jgi:hypothetical protein
MTCLLVKLCGFPEEYLNSMQQDVHGFSPEERGKNAKKRNRLTIRKGWVNTQVNMALTKTSGVEGVIITRYCTLYFVCMFRCPECWDHYSHGGFPDATPLFETLVVPEVERK